MPSFLGKRKAFYNSGPLRIGWVPGYDGSSGARKRTRISGKYSGRKARGYTRTGGYYGRFARHGMSKPEMKFFDLSILGAPIPISTGGGLLATSINLINQGNGESDMIGRKVTIKRISIRGTAIFRTNTGTLSNLGSGNGLKIVMVLDRQCNGAAATVTQLYETADIDSFLNLENKSRFKILKDWWVSNTAVTGYNSTGNTYYVDEKRIHFEWTGRVHIPIEFSAQAGGARAISEVRSNNIWMMAFADQAPGNTAQVEFITRVRYLDD